MPYPNRRRSLEMRSGTGVSAYWPVKTRFAVVEGVQEAVGLLVGHGVHLGHDLAKRLFRLHCRNGQLAF